MVKADIMVSSFRNCKLSSYGIQIARVHQINDALSKLKSCIRITVALCRYLCWWTISYVMYHPPSSQCLHIYSLNQLILFSEFAPEYLNHVAVESF